MPSRLDRWRSLIVNPFVIFFLTVAIPFPFFLYNIGPDATAYASIAGNYAAGRWMEAVNSHWSPMFSWLLAPFLISGLPVLIALKLLSVASGAFALYSTRRWTRTIGLGTPSRTAAEAVAAVTIASFSLLQAGPDLLLGG